VIAPARVSLAACLVGGLVAVFECVLLFGRLLWCGFAGECRPHFRVLLGVEAVFGTGFWLQFRAGFCRSGVTVLAEQPGGDRRLFEHLATHRGRFLDRRPQANERALQSGASRGQPV